MINDTTINDIQRGVDSLMHSKYSCLWRDKVKNYIGNRNCHDRTSFVSYLRTVTY